LGTFFSCSPNDGGFENCAQLVKGVFIMFNTQPAYPHSKPSPPLANSKGGRRGARSKRKRGGQLGNTNALIHGLYSVHHPHPAAAFIKSAASTTQPPVSDPDSISIQVKIWRQSNLALLEDLESTSNYTVYNALLQYFFRNCSSIAKLAKVQYALGAEKRLLKSLAEHSGYLIAREFQELGIPKHPVFVPHSSKNLSHLSTFCGSLDPSGAFLTDRHWFIIESLFTELQAEREEEARNFGLPRPRRSPYPDRFVLDGILWKLVTSCRWDQLPPEYPVRRCQRLYRKLYNTGRMAAIYEALLLDLYVYGDTTLESLVEEGEYKVHAGKIIYIPKETPDWQHVVALLLLQRAYLNFRKLKRENRVERLRREKCLRLPPLPPLPSLRSRLALRKRDRPPLPPGTFTVPPAHNHPVLLRHRIAHSQNGQAWSHQTPLQYIREMIGEELENP
jgi:transposase